jgi:Holliday junction resolvase
MRYWQRSWNMVLNSKVKGANGERELAQLLTSWAREIGIELDLIRNLEQVRSGGHDLLGVPGLATECKRVEVLAVNTWWGQAQRQAREAGLQPLLAYRQNRKKWQFITETWVWPCKTRPIVIHMDEEEAKVWFHGHLVHHFTPQQQPS